VSILSSKTFTATERWLITLAVMSATIMQLLDTTIVNVALPHMQASLNAAPDQITWILTSYLVSSAIFMPLTGYFSDRLGRKNYFLICIAGFVGASILCGASTSLSEIVIFRLLQGLFGAGLVPLSQAIMTDIFPEEERGKAMAIWGVGIMLGPILGPTLGGYLLEIANWRWLFYINVPVGIFSLLLAWRVVPDTVKKPRDMDWFGFFLIAVAIGATQYLLDRGNRVDWFDAMEIRIAAVLAVSGLLGFIIHQMRPDTKAVFDMRIFKDRNFTLCSLLLAAMGIGLYGTMVVQPLMMENLLNYPVLTTGLAMAPRGIGSMLGMLLVGRLIKNVDPRLLIIIGILFSAAGTAVGMYYNLQMSMGWFVWPLLIQGFGIGLIFVPLSVVAFSTLSAHLRTEATGLYSLLRTMGGSIGISIVITLFTRYSQQAWNNLGGFIQPFNPAVATYLKPLHLDPYSPLGSAVLGQVLSRQSQIVALDNVFALITWVFILMLPCVFLLRKGPKNRALAVQNE
jgi:DHA2 family multidrug resistance protein